jgi:phosphoribosyl 1,2-cyclic phosphodiesterase
VDVYASKETFDKLKLSGHRFHEIVDMQQFVIGSWQILPFSTIHDVGGSLGFYMQNKENEAFLYLTDSAYSPVRFQNLHTVACECNFINELLTENVIEGRIPWFVGKRILHTHFSLETLVKMLQSNDLSHCKRIFLLHLSGGNSDSARMIREVQEQTGIATDACD